jgi:hypothetical protein
MSQIKILECRDFLEKEDENFKSFLKAFQLVAKMEQQLTEAMVKFEKALEKFAENEINGVIAKIIRDVAKNSKSLT